jgi:PAS domain S-box-containing protein
VSTGWSAWVLGAPWGVLLAVLAWRFFAYRQRTQALVKENDRKLRELAAVVRHSSNAVARLDRHLHIMWVNEGFTQLYGYTSDEAVGKTPGRLLSSENADPLVLAQLKAAGALKQSCRVEVLNRTKAGDEVWISTEIQPLFDDSGASTGFIEIGTDITQRITLQDHLRQQNEVMQTIIENLPCGLSVVDGEMNVIRCNSQFAQLLEFPDELMAPRPLSFESLIRFNAQRGEYGEGAEDSVPQIMERARHTEPHRFERVRPNGTALEVVGVPMPGGGFITTYADVTNRVRAERALSLSNERFEIAADAAGLGVWDLDPATRITQWDRRMYQLYGQEPDCGIAPTELWTTCLHPEDRTRIRGEMLAALRGETLYNTDFRIVWPSGEVRHLHAMGRVVRDSDGLPLRMTGINIDITDRKRTEAALTESKYQAEQASVAKSQFLANMSHEIRTPMNAILGMLKLLMSTPLTERQRDYASKTERAARSMLDLLNDILDFSKVEAGKMKLDPQPFGLDLLLRDLAVILSATVGTKPVEVLFDVGHNTPRRLVGDAMRLQQILINLCGNAIKFTQRGEVVLSIKVLAATEQDVTLQFAVRDTGIGIAPENQAHIFSGFSQAEASTTRRFGGTGLGLAISSRLVDIMGGELTVASQVERGSTFSFSVPLMLAEPGSYSNGEREGASDPLEVPASEGQTTVLVVDDNDTAREIMANMGRSLGWAVETAASGQEALRMIENRCHDGKPFEAILLDWQMPGMDGWETAKAIRQQTADGYAPVVVMVTTHGRDMLSDHSAAVQNLINGFLVKPVTASMLFDGMAEARRSMAGLPPLITSVLPPTPRPLAGLRLLLVEDNPVNQQVGSELLSAQGAEMVVVANGLLAVNATQASGQTDPPFDAILMDLQMPVMDGYTATAQIRARFGPEVLPVIAMTANTMASDREACLAAGMNDHVGKPYELEQLVSTLLYWTGRSSQRTAQDEAAPVTVHALGLSELPLLDIATARERMGNEHALYTRMLERFASDVPQRLIQLQVLIQDQDSLAAERLLHGLKGEAGTLGAMQFAGSANMAELAYKKAGVRAKPESIVAPLNHAWGQTHAAIIKSGLIGASLKKEPAADRHPEPNSTVALSRLQEIRQLLRASDLQALGKMEAWRSEGVSGPHWQALDDAVQGMDFSHAEQLCEKWIASLAAV